ncbi:hypothetical protein MYX76_12110 [Desulfobacterota bacterium AH_259_B03_O07]|nr:hypothetical protein [Desulfobacterota bacterium AH_259_B03_O07]
MPRLARLDSPGVLHHVIIRGIERRFIFKADQTEKILLKPTLQTFVNDATGGWLCGQPWGTTFQNDGLQAHRISYLLIYGRPYFFCGEQLTKKMDYRLTE